MKDILNNSMFFGVLVSILAYEVGVLLKKKFKFALLNPLLISIVIIILILVGFHIDYDTYNDGAQLLSYLLTPATVCLAIPLYEQMELLKKNWKAIMGGIISGVLTSAVCILVLCLIFHLEHDMFVTLLPKSITTAIAVSYTHLIIITGGSACGLFYGMQTLRQMTQQEGCCLPYTSIQDRPQIEHRGFYHDVTRGRIPTMDYLKKLVDRMACLLYTSRWIRQKRQIPIF